MRIYYLETPCTLGMISTINVHQLTTSSTEDRKLYLHIYTQSYEPFAFGAYTCMNHLHLVQGVTPIVTSLIDKTMSTKFQCL